MIGNAWEWTADWFSERHAADAAACCGRDSRQIHAAARRGQLRPAQPEVRIPRKVLKGGSFLCAANYCQRYRPAARITQMIDTGTNHISFRCIIRTTHFPAGEK